MGLLAILLYGVGFLTLCMFAIVLAFLLQQRSQAKYFRARGIPFENAGTTNMFLMVRGTKDLPALEIDLYQKARQSKQPLIGLADMTGRLFYVTDVESMKHIYVKDFDHFVNRRPFTKVDSDMFSKMMLTMEDEYWKAMRSKLSPIFTTGKIRRMYSIFESSSLRMCEYLENLVGQNGKDFDICKVFSKYAVDVIASCAFGVDSQCYERGPDQISEFEDMANRFQLKFTAKVLVKFLMTTHLPKLAQLLDIHPFDAAPQRYFGKVIREVMKRRRETGEKPQDFLQLMMETQEGLLKSEEDSKETLEVMTGSQSGESSKNVFSSSVNLKIDDDAVIANCELFLLAGFDTLQSLLIYAAYALAREPEVQETLFKEVDQSIAENGGKLTYDALIQMNYLDLFINETLRYFPPATRTERVCTKDYQVPGTDFVIEKGSIVVLPIYGLHRDEEHYNDVDKFDPNRFLPENKSKRHPYSFVPFGQGPRNCLGMRFALTEVKAVVAHFVHHFKLEPCSKTDIPPKYSNNPSLKPKNGMWLKIQPRLRIHEE